MDYDCRRAVNEFTRIYFLHRFFSLAYGQRRLFDDREPVNVPQLASLAQRLLKAVESNPTAIDVSDVQTLINGLQLFKAELLEYDNRVDVSQLRTALTQREMSQRHLFALVQHYIYKDPVVDSDWMKIDYLITLLCARSDSSGVRLFEKSAEYLKALTLATQRYPMTGAPMADVEKIEKFFDYVTGLLKHVESFDDVVNSRIRQEVRHYKLALKSWFFHQRVSERVIRYNIDAYNRYQALKHVSDDDLLTTPLEEPTANDLVKLGTNPKAILIEAENTLQRLERFVARASKMLARCERVTALPSIMRNMSIQQWELELINGRRDPSPIDDDLKKAIFEAIALSLKIQEDCSKFMPATVQSAESEDLANPMFAIYQENKDLLNSLDGSLQDKINSSIVAGKQEEMKLWSAIQNHLYQPSRELDAFYRRNREPEEKKSIAAPVAGDRPVQPPLSARGRGVRLLRAEVIREHKGKAAFLASLFVVIATAGGLVLYRRSGNIREESIQGLSDHSPVTSAVGVKSRKGMRIYYAEVDPERWDKLSDEQRQRFTRDLFLQVLTQGFHSVLVKRAGVPVAYTVGEQVLLMQSKGVSAKK